MRLSTGNVHVFEYGRAVYISGRGMKLVYVILNRDEDSSVQPRINNR